MEKYQSFREFLKDMINEDEKQKIIYYKTISSKEWRETPKDFKTRIDGVRYKMFLDPEKGTILAPVKIDKKLK